MRQTRVVGRVGVAGRDGAGRGQVVELGDLLVLGTGDTDRAVGFGRHGYPGEQKRG